MIYRIDFQHFLLHAIDHFTRDELVHFQYMLISSGVKCNHKVRNVVKCIDLYPRNEVVIDYGSDGDENILEARMFEEYDRILKESPDIFYSYFLNMISRHIDVVIVCDKLENIYIDILSRYVKKKFNIEIVDLNKLFTEGRIGPIYLDRDEIWDQTVDIRRAAGRMMLQSLESTQDGRMKMVKEIMSKKQKLEKLRELGVKVRRDDRKNLDQLLIEAWVEDGDD